LSSAPDLCRCEDWKNLQWIFDLHLNSRTMAYYEEENVTFDQSHVNFLFINIRYRIMGEKGALNTKPLTFDLQQSTLQEQYQTERWPCLRPQRYEEGIDEILFEQRFGEHQWREQYEEGIDEMLCTFWTRFILAVLVIGVVLDIFGQPETREHHLRRRFGKVAKL
jgi:hypothetical protein